MGRLVVSMLWISTENQPRNLKYKAKLRARVETDAVEAKSKVEKSIAIKA